MVDVIPPKSNVVLAHCHEGYIVRFKTWSGVVSKTRRADGWVGVFILQHDNEHERNIFRYYPPEVVPNEVYAYGELWAKNKVF